MQRCFLKASKGEAYTKRRCVERTERSGGNSNGDK